jgi:hypothetical protein
MAAECLILEEARKITGLGDKFECDRVCAGCSSGRGRGVASAADLVSRYLDGEAVVERFIRRLEKHQALVGTPQRLPS